MKKYLLFLPLLFVVLASQDAPPIAITSPVPNEALRGEVNIIGSTDVPNFVSAQLDFAYASSPAETWFPLQTISQSVFDSPLYTWDTTTITDGDYVLRLRVVLGDGTTQEVTVRVSVQNDTVPMPTSTPTAAPDEVIVLIPTPFLLAASPTPTELPHPTPSPLPTNPVSLQQKQIYASLGRGALVILALFAIAGLIVRFRRF